MARDRSPITKQSRREGYALHPKAHKLMVKRSTMPGQHGRSRRRTKQSQYAIQLREKQKVKRLYGLLERQFRNLMKEADKAPGKSGVKLLELLERRLDNVVYRSNWAASRRAARQLVSHGHIAVNGNRVTIPSFRVSAGDVVSVRTKSRSTEYFKHLDDQTGNIEQPVLSWLKPDSNKLEAKITGSPTREEAEPDINEQLIVEYYSR